MKNILIKIISVIALTLFLFSLNNETFSLDTKETVNTTLCADNNLRSNNGIRCHTEYRWSLTYYHISCLGCSYIKGRARGGTGLCSPTVGVN